MENKASDGKDKVTVLSVENVSKKYSKRLRSSLWYGVKDIAREFMIKSDDNRRDDLRKEEFYALRNISFDLKRGESLAIMGDNGAGKSTLLKLLYGLIRPDNGRIAVSGSVGAIIELGAGFDLVLSGRENIYLRAALFGFSRSEVNSMIDEIVDFAEIGEFIDSPVQFYSSGMIARLSFAISTCLKPAILLVDEVLAVGDIDFQRKCINQIAKYISDGGSMILVSHVPLLIQSVCQRCILLDHGRIAFQGTALEAISVYHKRSSEKIQKAQPDPENAVATDKKPIVIEEAFIKPIKGSKIYTNEKVQIVINYRARQNLPGVGFTFMIFSLDEMTCIAGDVSKKSYSIKQGDGSISCGINDFPLMPGDYLLKISIYQSSNYVAYTDLGHENPPLKFTVSDSELNLSSSSSKILNQLVALNAEWT